MSDDKNLLAFKAILSFVSDLASSHKTIRSLQLYNRILSYIRFSNYLDIAKQCELFTNFCVNNRDAILERSVEKILSGTINYNDRIYIDIKVVFSFSDSEQKEFIWRHLLTISAILDPSANAKQILKQMSVSDNSPEIDFMNNLMSKMETSIKPDASPTEAITTIMQSGVLTDLIGNLESNKLDMGKLIGMAQSFMSKMGSETKNPQLQQMLNTTNGVLANANTNTNANSPQDMTMMLQLMSSMMNGMNSNK